MSTRDSKAKAASSAARNPLAQLPDTKAELIATLGDMKQKEETTREEAADALFSRRFSDWLAVRAEREDPDGDDSDDALMDGQAREDEAARLVMITPVRRFWMLLQKLEVLEYYVGQSGGPWCDHREVMMLACIKADLLKFEPRFSG